LSKYLILIVCKTKVQFSIIHWTLIYLWSILDWRFRNHFFRNSVFHLFDDGSYFNWLNFDEIAALSTLSSLSLSHTHNTHTHIHTHTHTHTDTHTFMPAFFSFTAHIHVLEEVKIINILTKLFIHNFLLHFSLEKIVK